MENACKHLNSRGNACGLEAGHASKLHFTVVENAKKHARNWDHPSQRFLFWLDDGKVLTRAQWSPIAAAEKAARGK